MKAGLFRKLGLVAACLSVLGLSSAFLDQDACASRVGVLVSSKIRPYLEAAEGVAETLGQAPGIDAETFFLDKYAGAKLADLSEKMAAENFDLLIAIGPGAARFAWSSPNFRGALRLYAMVLNPESVIDSTDRPCGISLNIPPAEQVGAIARGYPGVVRLGMLFDPLINQDLFAHYRLAAADLGLSILPLKISSKRDIPAVLEKNWTRMDALWFVPDRTVISESIVEYVIQEAIYRKIPVIGYNRFFYESGASLAFVIDYRQVGVQCAKEAIDMLAGGPCRKLSPVFQLWVNTRVMGKLGVQGPARFTPPLQEGP